MSSNRKIYSASWDKNIAAAGGYLQCYFRINSANREIYIRSIAIELQFKDTVTGLLLPEYTNTTQEFNCSIGTPNSPLTLPFDFYSGDAFVSNGLYLYFSRSGQWFYENPYIKNMVYCFFNVTNHAANIFDDSVYINIETQEKITYQ